MATTTPAHRAIQELGGIYRWNKIRQAQAAQITGISSSAISRRLNGEVSPTLDEFFALAEAAGVKVTLELTSPDVEAVAS